VIFHFVTEQNMLVISVPFGDELPKLRVDEVRPSYVTIDKDEIEKNYNNLSDAQMVSYLKMIKNKLDFGGKVFIEVANYE